MCGNCWRAVGSPTEQTPDTARLVGLINNLYEIQPLGGPLHATLDDYNLDGFIEPYYESYEDEELDELWFGGARIAELSPNAPAVTEGLGRSMRQLCDEIAALLNGMTEPQRYAALACADELICPQEGRP